MHQLKAKHIKCAGLTPNEVSELVKKNKEKRLIDMDTTLQGKKITKDVIDLLGNANFLSFPKHRMVQSMLIVNFVGILCFPKSMTSANTWAQ